MYHIHSTCYVDACVNGDYSELVSIRDGSIIPTRGSGYFLGGAEILFKNSRGGQRFCTKILGEGVADFARHSTPSNLYKSP